MNPLFQIESEEFNSMVNHKILLVKDMGMSFGISISPNQANLSRLKLEKRKVVAVGYNYIYFWNKINNPIYERLLKRNFIIKET